MKRKKLVHGLALLCIWGLSLGALRYSLDSHYVVKTYVLNAGVFKARKALKTDRCKVAFMAEGGRYSGLEPLPAFESTKAVELEWLWPPHINGAANCDVSFTSYLIGTGRAMWGGSTPLAKTHIHEFVHLLDCPDLIREFGSQDNMSNIAHDRGGTPLEAVAARQYIEDSENRAYRISNLCMGSKVPDFAKKKKKEKIDANAIRP